MSEYQRLDVPIEKREKESGTIKTHLFGEYAEYRTKEEKLDVYHYLYSWKTFFLRKHPNIKFIAEEYVEFEHPIIKFTSIGLKLMCECDIVQCAQEAELADLCTDCKQIKFLL